jgi:hypothetical protein
MPGSYTPKLPPGAYHPTPTPNPRRNSHDRPAHRTPLASLALPAQARASAVLPSGVLDRAVPPTPLVAPLAQARPSAVLPAVLPSGLLPTATQIAHSAASATTAPYSSSSSYYSVGTPFNGRNNDVVSPRTFQSQCFWKMIAEGKTNKKAATSTQDTTTHNATKPPKVCFVWTAVTVYLQMLQRARV